jgi:hypothetical protein
MIDCNPGKKPMRQATQEKTENGLTDKILSPSEVAFSTT